MGQKKKGRVLIVEDDMLLSMVEERIIEKLGYEVVGKLVYGEEAVDKVDELNTDVIVMDISLKGDMDGIEAMEKIREKSDIPVIYLSGSTDRYHYERARKTNFIAYLKKPVTSSDLKDPLENAVEELSAD
jgi:CheY-like chemotaxis protein